MAKVIEPLPFGPRVWPRARATDGIDGYKAHRAYVPRVALLDAGADRHPKLGNLVVIVPDDGLGTANLARIEIKNLRDGGVLYSEVAPR
jgi:hypothetical protein